VLGDLAEREQASCQTQPSGDGGNGAGLIDDGRQDLAGVAATSLHPTATDLADRPVRDSGAECGDRRHP